LKHRHGKIIILIIYIDNMVVTDDDNDGISKQHQYLASEFEMKQFGDLKFFIGIEVAWSNHGVFLSQWKNILDLLIIWDNNASM